MITVLNDGTVYDLSKKGLTHDGHKFDINATLVAEEHALLFTLIRLTMVKVPEIERIVVSPSALTMLVSGSQALPDDFSMEHISLYGYPLFIDPRAEEDFVIVEGKDGNYEIVHIKNLSFLLCVWNRVVASKMYKVSVEDAP